MGGKKTFFGVFGGGIDKQTQTKQLLLWHTQLFVVASVKIVQIFNRHRLLTSYTAFFKSFIWLLDFTDFR
jgi:hypothetical protein